MAKLKRIGILSGAKLGGIFAGLNGLVLGIIYSFGGFILDALVTLGVMTSSETPGLSYGTVLAFGALIGMPAIAAICGMVVGAIGAVLYNFLAKKFGGIEWDVKI